MYIPGFNQAKFIATRRETPGKCGYIKVYQNQGTDSYEPCWSLMPKPSSPKISFVSILHSDVLLTVDQEGTVYTYDLIKKKELTETILEASCVWGCLLIDEGNGVVVFYTKKRDFHVRSCILELASGKLKHQKEYQNLNKIILPTIIGASEIAAYCPVGGSNRSTANDSFVRINIKTGELHEAEITPSPTGSFSVPPVAICPEFNCGVRPSYQPVKTEKIGDKTRYWAEFAMFDLSSGRLKHMIKSRAFHPEDLFEDDDPKYALSCFELSPLADDYRDVRDEFMERFDSMVYSSKQKCLWISYQHGVLQKVSLDPISVSPLMLHPGDNSYQSDNHFRRTGFDSPLSLTPDEGYLYFGSPEVAINTNALKFDQAEEWIDIPEQLIIDSELNSINPVDIEFSWNILKIKDPDSDSGLKEGLHQLLEAMSDIPAIKDGTLLRFRFETETGLLLSEKEFFKKVAEEGRLHEILASYIERIIEHGQPLWYDDELPVGFWAVESLITANPGHIKLLTAYINSVLISTRTPEALLTLIDETIKSFGWAHETIDLVLNLAYFHNESGIEKLLECFNSEAFVLYLKDCNHSNYLESHSLYRSLVDEHFSTFRPLEEKLFSAIEYEDVDTIKKILTDQPDLSVRHPDFNLTALELAFEVNNREIIQILIDAGAKELGEGYLTLDEVIDALNETVTKDTDLHTDQINALQKQKFKIQNEISKIEFNQMITFQLTKEDQERLDHLNQNLREIQTQLKHMNLGLFNFNINRAASREASENHSHILQKNSEEFIDENSILEIEPKDTTVYIEGLEEAEQINAFKQIINLVCKPLDISKNDTFRIGFNIKGKLLSEQGYFSKIHLTNPSALLLEKAINKLLKVFNSATWYDADTPALFNPVQALAMFHADHLVTLINYLKFLLNYEEEPACISELIFDVFDNFPWSDETLNLAAYRFTLQNNEAANVEIRLQLKKGGLNDYLSIDSNFQKFEAMLSSHSGSPEITDILVDKMLSFLKHQKS